MEVVNQNNLKNKMAIISHLERMTVFKYEILFNKYIQWFSKYMYFNKKLNIIAPVTYKLFELSNGYFHI